MKKFNTPEEALASQNFDPKAVKFEGVPERHVDALKSVLNLFVAHDAVNPDFQVDFANYDQDKYEAIHEIGSRSGAGFSSDGCDIWNSRSSVGARLVSENSEACEHIAELFHEDYKNMKSYDRKIV